MELVKNPPEPSASLAWTAGNSGLTPGKPGVFLFECPLRLFDAAVLEPGDKVVACADEDQDDRIVVVYRRAA
jgi:hypothetical protein